MTNRTADAFLFFRAWLSAPLRVASVIPSGRALSSLMTAEISAKTGTVIELGPGTGVFTKALLHRGVAEENLVLIEYGADFATQLSLRFPTARIIEMDAAKLRKLPLQGSAPVGAVVSGLPLLSMPMRKVHTILEGAFSHLRHDGVFYQFTFGPRCPIARPLLDRLGLKARYIGCTLANIPPAAVYRISRRRPRRAFEPAHQDLLFDGQKIHPSQQQLPAWLFLFQLNPAGTGHSITARRVPSALSQWDYAWPCML